MRCPLVAGAYRADGEPLRARRLFELEGVPCRDCFGDSGGVGRNVQESAPARDLVRVDRRYHDPATIPGAVGDDGERVVEQQGVGGRLPVQRRMPKGSRVDGVHGLAQVELEVLCGSTPVPVERDGRDCARHERNADAGPEPVCGGQDGVLSGEGDGAAGLCPGEADVREQIVESVHGIEVGRLGGRSCARGRGAATIRGLVWSKCHREAPFFWATIDSVGTEKCRSNAITARAPGRNPRLHHRRDSSTPGCHCPR